MNIRKEFYNFQFYFRLRQRNKRYGFGDGVKRLEKLFTKKRAYNVGTRSGGAQQPPNNFYYSGSSSSSSSSSGYGDSSSSSQSTSSGSSSGDGYVNLGRPCTTKFRKISNAIAQCSIVLNTCAYQCLDGYQFPNGDIRIKMFCSDGEWVFENSKWNDEIACERKFFYLK